MNLAYEYIEETGIDILMDGIRIGYFRYFDEIDYDIDGKRLIRFLAYIWVDREYRRKGILSRVVRDWDIRSLCVDESIDSDSGIGREGLIGIYEGLGFKLYRNKNQFMHRG